MQSKVVVSVTEGDVKLVPGAGAAMSVVRVRARGMEVLLHKPEEGQAEPWCCMVAFVRAGLEVQDEVNTAVSRWWCR